MLAFLRRTYSNLEGASRCNEAFFFENCFSYPPPLIHPCCSRCNEAPAGYFVNETGAVAPVPCGKGSYAAVSGLEACKQCEAGYISAEVGAQHCSGCKQGALMLHCCYAECRVNQTDHPYNRRVSEAPGAVGLHPLSSRHGLPAQRNTCSRG